MSTKSIIVKGKSVSFTLLDQEVKVEVALGGEEYSMIIYPIFEEDEDLTDENVEYFFNNILSEEMAEQMFEVLFSQYQTKLN